MKTTGSCNCDGVTYSVDGPLREAVACHCGQCRKQTGLYFAATDVADDDLTIENSDTLAWYAASDFAKRGFCSTCGSALFWKANDSDTTSLLIGALNDTGDLKLKRHIFVADKGDFYDIPADEKQFEQDDLHDPRPRAEY